MASCTFGMIIYNKTNNRNFLEFLWKYFLPNVNTIFEVVNGIYTCRRVRLCSYINEALWVIFTANQNYTTSDECFSLLHLNRIRGKIYRIHGKICYGLTYTIRYHGPIRLNIAKAQLYQTYSISNLKYALFALSPRLNFLLINCT